MVTKNIGSIDVAGGPFAASLGEEADCGVKRACLGCGKGTKRAAIGLISRSFFLLLLLLVLLLLLLLFFLLFL